MTNPIQVKDVFLFPSGAILVNAEGAQVPELQEPIYSLLDLLAKEKGYELEGATFHAANQGRYELFRTTDGGINIRTL